MVRSEKMKEEGHLGNVHDGDLPARGEGFMGTVRQRTTICQARDGKNGNAVELFDTVRDTIACYIWDGARRMV